MVLKRSYSYIPYVLCQYAAPFLSPNQLLRLVDHLVSGSAKDAFVEADTVALAKAFFDKKR